MDVAPQYYNFSRHLESDSRLFFANLEESLWQADGKRHWPADANGQWKIIDDFCIHEKTHPNGYYYEQLEESQERTVRAISC